MPTKPTGRPVGRPTKYTPELCDYICKRIADGESLRTICAADDMPDRESIFTWLGDYPEFSAKYARAREIQADHMDDLILETAANITPDTAKADAVRIEAYKWRAGRLLPKKYGDKLQTEISGPDGGSVQFGDTERAAKLQHLMTLAMERMQQRGIKSISCDVKISTDGESD